MTIAKFFPKKEKGYFHRVHRTNRNKFVAKESFDEHKLKPVLKKDKVKLDIDKLVKCDDLKKEASGVHRKISKPKDTYPSMACCNCSHIFQLCYYPLRDKSEQILSSIICPRCHQNAYFQNYYSINFIRLFYSTAYFYIRDLIKSGQMKLQDFL